MNRRWKTFNINLYLAALILTLATFQAAPARALTCGVITVCPTNFANVNGLGAPVRMIASGGTSIWALDTNLAIYRWNSASRVFDSIPGSLAWISVGGGTFLEPDEVWGYNAAGQYYRWSSGGWVQIPVPRGLGSSLVIGKGFNNSCHPYEVWAIGTANRFNGNNIWRYNYCSLTWQQIPGQLSSLSVGGGEVWGLAWGQIWRFNTDTQSGWTQIPGVLTSLAVGSDGVWGVNASQQVFQFSSATQTFVQIPGATLTSVAAGGNGVWGLNASHQVFRYQAVNRTFVLSPSVLLNQITVGSGGGVWGIDTANNIRVFVTPAVSPGTVAQ